MKTEREIFLEALEMTTPEARAAYLQGACGHDVTLRRKVDELLKEHFSNDSLLAGSPLEEARPAATIRVAPPEESGARMIGRYKLLEKIGEGGFGEVWMAEQREPVKRRVALKIIKLGMDSRQIVARFEAERQALAMMDHPNIAKIFDAGTTGEAGGQRSEGRGQKSAAGARGAEDASIPTSDLGPLTSGSGRPYFVMELVRGIKITEYCDQNQLATLDRLKLFILVCQAIQHAHQKGIIHRDIKPSNILVTLHDGVPVPKVIDFGIAKATQQELTDKTVFTQFQQFIGTPAYISPEQAEMSGLDIDTRADIYSLGVLLYELLVGQTPFDPKEMMKGGIDALRKVIREKEPTRPSTKLNTLLGEDRTTAAKRRQTEVGKLVHQLQGDLDWIVMKCLEKDRTRRYETANGVAMDIQRHLNNEAVLARPPSAAYRFQKMVRRNKLAFAAGAAVVLALVIGIGVSTWQMIRVSRGEREQNRLRQVAVTALEGEKEQRTQAEVERQRAEQRALEARKRAYASDMNVAKKALDENNLGHALDMLNQHVPKPGETDLRGWEWRYLWSQTRSDALFTLCQETNQIRSLSVSSDGNFLTATVHGRGGLSIWSVPERREVRRLAQDEEQVCAAISPTEPLVAFTGIRFDASGQQRSSLRLWNFVTRKMTMERPLDGECTKLAFSVDGRRLVTVTSGNHATYQYQGIITLWSLPEGVVERKYPLPGGSGGFAVTPDLGLAAVSMNGLRVIKLADGQELWRKEKEASVLAFSPDGKWLAGDWNGQDIQVWNAETGEETGRLTGHQSSVQALVFWPDGKKLASGSADQTIRIWDVASQTCLDTLRGHRQQVWELTLMPDQQTLVSGCRDGTVCLWNTLVSHPRRRRINIPDKAVTWAFEADSKSVVTFNEQGRVVRWKGPNFEIPETLLETGDIPKGVILLWCFSSDGRRFARSSPEGIVRVWDIPSRTLWRQIPNAHGQLRRMFGGGNRLLLLSLDDFVVHDLDLTTGAEVQSWQAPAGFLHFAISPDERYCVTLGYAGDAVITDLLKKTSTRLNLDARESHDGTYSPDGRLLAVPNSLGFVQIWDTTTWNVKILGGFFGEVFGSVFLPDGTRLAAVAGGQEAVRLYDTSTWLDTLTLDDDAGGRLWPTLVSPDGNVIGATTFGGWDLRLWRAPSWEEINAAEAKEKSETKQP